MENMDMGAFQRLIAQMQNQYANPKEEDYPQYRLPTFIFSERSFHALDGELDPAKERAFTIANKVPSAIESGNFADANKMAYQAYQLDPLCVDAWRSMVKVLNEYSDGDTIISATRELLYFSRRFYQEEFHQNGMFYSISTTRPYMRILTDLAEIATVSSQIDVATYCYEEMVRLNHHDNTGARDPLLCCYVKLIGRARRYPNSTRPIRTINHARQLIKCCFDDESNTDHCPLFEKDNLCVRWAELCFMFAEKGNWKKVARREHQKNDLIFQLIFDEVTNEEIPAAAPDMPADSFLVGSKSDDVRARGGWIKEALLDWPDFVIELYRLLRGKVTPQFEAKVRSIAPIPEEEARSEFKAQMKKLGEEFLDKGRDNLRSKQFDQAIFNFTLAKRSYYETSQPSRRLYLHQPFAIISNRATAAYFLRKWNFLRIDLRFTLKMKPDHEKSYAKLPKLADAYKAKQLVDEFKQIAQMVERKEVNTEEEWKSLANRAIGLTSMTALAFAAVDKLTEEMKEELIRVGIEDCYTTVNVDLVHPLLPWLTVDDLEKPIPNV
ncbi:hypothetical protein M9Y10_040257 [Tritrichomonas musculus]|uniref:KIF-binding protein n=1 Tax=Tritrichomonas musculus TaxID=1915356 RepID=A0ABR2GPL4_9EUKA